MVSERMACMARLTSCTRKRHVLAVTVRTVLRYEACTHRIHVHTCRTSVAMCLLRTVPYEFCPLSTFWTLIVSFLMPLRYS